MRDGDPATMATCQPHSNVLSHVGMNVRSCYRLPMNRVALYYFIAALVSFVAFHFVPMTLEERGWIVWRQLFNFVRVGWQHARAEDMINHSLWLWMTLQSLSGPFLIPMLIGSKLMRRLIVSASSIAFIGCLLPLGVTGQLSHYRPGFWILASLGFHFVGCFCIRRPKPEEFVPASTPDS